MYFSHHACIRFYVRSCHDEHHRYKRMAQVPPWYSLAFQISDLRRYVIMQQSSRPLKRQSSVSVLLTTATTTSPPTRHSWGKAVMETSIDRIHCNKKAKSNWFGNLGVMAWIFRIKTHGLIIEGLCLVLDDSLSLTVCPHLLRYMHPYASLSSTWRNLHL